MLTAPFYFIGRNTNRLLMDDILQSAMAQTPLP